MIRVDTRPRKRNAPRPAWKVCQAFGQWLRGRACACGGRNPNCGGPMQACHVDYAGKGTPDAKGAGTKVADRWQIPMTVNCHQLPSASARQGLAVVRTQHSWRCRPRGRDGRGILAPLDWRQRRTRMTNLSDLIERGRSLHDKLIECHPSLARRQVWCTTCGHTQRVENGLRDGWPRHCGYTMTIDSPEERASLRALQEKDHPHA